MGTALARFLGLAALWIVLIRSVQPADLAVGALTAAAATWVSLRFLPPDAGRVKFAALAARLPRFLWQSVVAGIDVARRALAPGMPLRTGFSRIARVSCAARRATRSRRSRASCRARCPPRTTLRASLSLAWIPRSRSWSSSRPRNGRTPRP
jgi:hypothetical protein